MKKTAPFLKKTAFLLILISLWFLPSPAPATMTDYCVVPPYVIQNVAPNVMFLLDNSFSMLEFAYYNCVVTATANSIAAFGGSWNGTAYEITVDSVDGFAVDDFIAVWDGLHGSPSDYWTGHPSLSNMKITSIDATNKKLMVDTALHYALGAPVIKRSCSYMPSSSNSNYFDKSFEPAKSYYGYFNPVYWYTYTSSGGGRFERSVLKSSRAKLAAEWDGSFLNWLTMKRIDVVRKALTGGASSGSCGSGCTTLGSEKADCAQRGRSQYQVGGVNYGNFNIRAADTVQNYIDTSLGSGTRCFWVESADDSVPYTCDGSGSGTASFKISTDGTCAAWGGSNYTAQVATTGTIEGVLHTVVGTRARPGLAFFKTASTADGAFVQTTIAGGSLSSTVNQINITRPSAATTPLAEALWSVGGYFAQDDSYASIGAPGPRYSGGDYGINANVDPYNYGTGGSPRFPKCAKSFVLLLTDGEPCGDGNLTNSILNYANGRSSYNCGTPRPRADECPAVGAFPAQILPGTPSCTAGNVAGLEDVALWSHTIDLRSTALVDAAHDIDGRQSLNLFVVHAFGSRSSTLMKYAAINGGFEDSNGNLVPDLQSEWDENSDGKPDTFFEANDGNNLEAAIRDALNAMLKRASSGTAASVLASGEGSGANLIQAVFYPRRRFGNDIIQWTGSLQNFWYYVDPFFQNSNVREDTDENKVLHLQNDYIAIPYFDQASQTTKARRYADTDGDGDADTTLSEVALENIKHLWEAGNELFLRDLSASPRTLYTNLNGTAFTPFTNTAASTFRPYLNVVNATDAFNVINYTHGNEVWVDNNADGLNDWRSRIVNTAGATSVWKLGDILNSTPKILSWLPMNSFDVNYKDNTYKDFIGDVDSTLPADSSARYKNRGTVFTGGNDGMLHAFKLGKLELTWSGQGGYEKGRLAGSDLGKELWSFIPKNVLPYLKYIPEGDYCHVYSVDLTPYIFDASIGIDPDTDGDGTPDQPAECDAANYYKCVKSKKSWRTVLIGGMRTGGACRKTGAACADVAGTPFAGDPTKDCVHTPIVDPDDASRGLGYSSYFAIDVTDPENPVFLWEFANENLGFSTTGPSILRIGHKTADTNGDSLINGNDAPDNTRNGRWYAVFGSGPTGPVYSTDMQFLGRSDQNLRLFVLDLRTGALLRTIDTGLQYAFAGSMINVNLDPDRDYQDDVLYFGHSRRTTSSPYTWTVGGVGRLITKEEIDPANWVQNNLIDGIGPVTAATVNLINQRNNALWLFFGSGRYYFDLQGTANDDDPASQRRIFGVTEPCFQGTTATPTFKTVCTDSITTNDLSRTVAELSDATSVDSSDPDGWYITLDAQGTYEGKLYYAERVITDPLALSTGLVFFTTYKPYNDECGLGGRSHIWAVKYSTGGAGGALLKGKALIQVSTGSIEQLDMKSAFADKGGRRSAQLEGVPPMAQGLSLISTPPPIKKVLHIREK